MATKAKKNEASIAEKLDALFNLQKIDSEIDRIRTIRGELPLEVEDLEDEIEGLSTRVEKLEGELSDAESAIAGYKNTIKEATAAIEKYKEQQNNVRNNREYESLSKEIEFQTLEIQLSEKRIKEAKFDIENKKEVVTTVKETLERRKGDLDAKKGELDEIVAETQKDEEDLVKKSEKARQSIDDRLLSAYERLRSNSRNGLAVVPIERDSCGGCFNKIPPQRQMDIQAKKKVIVCEHCGRILVGQDMVEDI
ncbi:C4-type zinc ribbon domain-containing protein [Wandonia haliotis]|uniref:C4-type zinc ribbon domain-containing protein n=1 Tax=Wandonia haliotis TaxID=574963 RepID=A0ABP3Y296_9FLAO